eukprot:jgi/Ulvmu1/9850/UM057_0003.1
MDLALLTRMPDGLEVSKGGQPGAYIGRCVVRRSQVLRNILEESEEGDTCAVPLAVDRLESWRAFRYNDGSSLQVTTTELINLIMAADVLIDVKCLETVCYELSQRLFPRPGPPVPADPQTTVAQSDDSGAENQGPNHADVHDTETVAISTKDSKPLSATDCGSVEVIQALQALPDHVALSVMRAVTHLPALFAALPPSMHAAALRAHHPFIDSHAALTLIYPPLDTLPPTMRALSALGSLTAITLRMRPHGSANPEGMQPQEFLDRALCLLSLRDLSIDDWHMAKAPAATAAADAAAADAAAAAAPLTRLSLRNSSVSTRALAPRFGVLGTLRVLEVSAATRHDARMTSGRMVKDDAHALSAHLHKLTALEDLSLEHNRIAPEDWVKLAPVIDELPHLRAVNLACLQLPADMLFAGARVDGACDPPLTAESVRRVWRQIESLNVSGNLVCARNPVLWAALGQMSRLVRLAVADMPTELGIFVHLADALRAGHAVPESATLGHDVGEAQRAGAGDVTAWPAFRLESLDASGCRTIWGNAFETCMRAWPGLQRLVAAGTGRLERMGVPGQGLTAGRAPTVATGLAHVPALQELVLRDHKGLGPEGVKALAPALATLRALTLLDLSACGAAAAGAAALCPEVARLRKLQVLRLAANGMGSDGAGDLLAALVACEQLRDLDLSRNGAGDGLAPVVKARLSQHSALERLDLRGNTFREAKATLRALSMKRGNVILL